MKLSWVTLVATALSVCGPVTFATPVPTNERTSLEPPQGQEMQRDRKGYTEYLAHPDDRNVALSVGSPVSFATPVPTNELTPLEPPQGQEMKRYTRKGYKEYLAHPDNRTVCRLFCYGGGAAGACAGCCIGYVAGSCAVGSGVGALVGSCTGVSCALGGEASLSDCVCTTICCPMCWPCWPFVAFAMVVDGLSQCGTDLCRNRLAGRPWLARGPYDKRD